MLTLFKSPHIPRPEPGRAISPRQKDKKLGFLIGLCLGAIIGAIITGMMKSSEMSEAMNLIARMRAELERLAGKGKQ